MTELILFKASVIKNGFFNDSLQSWIPTGSGSWQFYRGYAQHNADGNANLTQYGVVHPTIKYTIKLKITGMAGGQSLAVTLGSGAVHTFTTNGAKLVELTATEDFFRIGASSGCAAKISNISVVEAPGSFKLDYYDDASLPTTYSIDDLRFPESRTTSYSKSVILPGTHNNNVALGNIFELGIESTFNPNKESYIVVKQDGAETFRGVLCLNDIIEKNTGSNGFRAVDYNVSFLGALGNLFIKWGDRTLRDLDFSEYNHVYNQNFVRSSWFGDIAKNGSYVNNTTTTYTSPAITAMAAVTFNGADRVKITFAGAHSFNIGDEVFGDTNNNLLSGFQTVVDITSTTITLNLLYSVLTDTSNSTGVFTDMYCEGFGYVYPMIDMGTMNGESHQNNEQNGPPLIIGKNYVIKSIQPGDSFSDVGAAIDWNGTAFTATGTTPAFWANGSTIAASSAANWRLNEFFPAIFMREILKKSFQLIGYDFNAPEFDTPLFRRAILPFSNGDNFLLSDSVIQQLEVRASMKDTVSQPTGRTYTSTYLLYPFPANHGDYPYDNEPIPIGTTPPQPSYWGQPGNPPLYQNVLYWTVDYNYDGYKPLPSTLLYYDGVNPYATPRNYFVKGLTYQVIHANPADDFSNVGGPSSPSDLDLWVATITGSCSNWNASSQVQILSAVASHHYIPQAGGSFNTKTSVVPFNHDQPPIDYDYGNNYSDTLYQFEMPSGYPANGVTFNFSFSGNVWNYIKDKYAFNGSTGDLPSDFAGSGAPGVYSARNGNYVPGNGVAIASEDRDGIGGFTNYIAIQKSINGGSSWTTLKYLGTDSPTTPISSTRFENTFVNGDVVVNMFTGDLIRVVLVATLKVIALNSTGHPCVGASSGGGAGSGNITGGTGGPVKCTVRVDNAIFQAKMVNTTISEDFSFSMNTVLPDIRIADFFLWVIQMHNCLVEPNKFDRKIIDIETRDDYYDDEVIDWTHKLDANKDLVQKPMAELNNKTYLYTYKADKDFYNEDYTTDWGGTFNRTYGDRRFEVDNDFVSGVNTTQIGFSPTPAVGAPFLYQDSDRVISAIYSQDTNGVVKKLQTYRFLYYNIRGTNDAWNLNSLTIPVNTIIDVRWAGSPTGFRYYPQALHMDNHLTPNADLTFGVPLAYYYDAQVRTLNDLFNRFHKNFIEEITDRDSKNVEADLLLTPADMQILNFRHPIKLRNHFLRLKKINEYDPTTPDTTLCEFIKIKRR